MSYSLCGDQAIRADDFWDGRWVTGRTSRGVPRLQWVWTGMPKIPNDVLQTAFYLYPNFEDAESGRGFGGTGFLIGRPLEGDPLYTAVYAVTNRHVAVDDGHSVIRLRKKDGSHLIIDLDPSEWEFDPSGHDIAAVPLPIQINELAAKCVPFSLLATKDIVASKGIGPGEEVFMVGRFIDADGGVVNNPAVRFGHISLMPVPVVPRSGVAHPSYCLDMHSRTGYSGSPVFAFRKPGQDLSTPVLDLSDQFLYLLGIHWGQFPEMWEIVHGEGDAQSESQVKLDEDARYVEGMSGMTCVAPADAIVEILNRPKLALWQDQANEQRKKDAQTERSHSAMLEVMKSGRMDFTNSSDLSAGPFPELPPQAPPREKH